MCACHQVGEDTEAEEDEDEEEEAEEEDEKHEKGRPLGSLDLVEVDFETCSAVLLQQVRQLSDHCFSEDGVEKAHVRGWKMTLLTETIPKRPVSLRGYLCHELRFPPQAEFHIHRLAVVSGHRGRGFGQQLMQCALAKAALIPESKCKWITLSALNSAVTFYERLGFTDLGCGDPLAEDGQTWMELRNMSSAEADDTDVSEGEDASQDGDTDVDVGGMSDREADRRS